MQLSQKQEIFSEFFLAFFKSTLNLEHFPKKKNLIAALFPKLRTPKKVFKKMSKKYCFRGPFDKRHGEPEKELLKSGTQHIYHIYT